MTPKLTIGMPHWLDFSRCSFTIEQFLINYADRLGDLLEIVVIDNSPGSPDSEQLARFIGSINSPWVRLYQTPNEIGPSGAKNAIFDVANAPAVLVMDCHVILHERAIPSLLAFYRSNPATMDLFSGPLVLNDGKHLQTEWVPGWRGSNWGKWHTDERGLLLQAPKYEIWGQGCGLFTCRKEAWLGFDQRCRGFGGAEEGVIHEWYRFHGRKVWCLPFLRWWHSFDRMNQPTPHNPADNKIRNYAMNFLKMKIHLDEMWQHFVSMAHEGPLRKHLVEEHSENPEQVNQWTDEQCEAAHKRHKVSQDEWERVIYEAEHGRRLTVDIAKTYEQMAAKIKPEESDMGSHMATLFNLAEKCNVVEEITRRRESTIALLFGLEGRRDAAATPILRSHYIAEIGSDFAAQVGNVDNVDWKAAAESWESVEVGECDMLFIKTPHNCHDLDERLVKWAPNVRRFIVVHDTSSHNELLDDGTTGYGIQLREFCKITGWFPIAHSLDQWGLTVLGNQEIDRPETPVIAWPPGYGPGTTLRKMLVELGVEDKPNCGCRRMSNQMDVWGVDGCRAHRAEIVEAIRENAGHWSWSEKLAIAANAVKNGVAWSISPTDIYGSLVDLAIEKTAT